MTVLTCDAAIPVVHGWWATCGQPAVATHRYSCLAGHVKTRSTCAAHQPEPGQVGCADCWDEGSDAAVTFEAVTS